MKRDKELVGKRFGRLVVIGLGEDYVSPKGQRQKTCVCRCDCGTERIFRATALTYGYTRSCGCLKNEKTVARMTKHGFSHKEALYNVWKGMRERCNNPNGEFWHQYGGRGIKVCAEWNDYLAFRMWAQANGWKKGLQVDRIDDTAGYSPHNCRIVTCKENNDHRNSPRDAKGRYMRKSP